MTTFALLLIALPVVLGLHAYVGYPILLRLVAGGRPALDPGAEPEEWPAITITVPAYNEAGAIRSTLDHLLRADYPADRRSILVISDASTDGTDDIVREYASRGVKLLRLPSRQGKTAAENLAHKTAQTEIIVNTDASVRIPAHSLKPLVRVFRDQTVGVASGRDISTGDTAAEGNRGESGYVGYEMGIRDLETRVGSIIGASGCFYAFRRGVDEPEFPEYLSRDFASALIARERGYRSVSVTDAVCEVPRARALGKEYRRKTRTMARGLATLWYKRHLMDPFRYGAFALMLISHKLCRWLVYPALPLALVGLILLSPTHVLARWTLAAVGGGLVLGAIATYWPAGRRVPLVLSVFGYALASTLAGLLAWVHLLRGERKPMWEPTRRPL